MLTPEETQRVQRKLDLNERLVWCGKPCPRAFNRATVAMMFFGIPWLTISGSASIVMLSRFWLKPCTEPLLMRFLFSLFFLPFWGIGVGMVGAPLWHRLRQRKWVYAVTDKSALIVGAFTCTRWRKRDLLTPDRADHRNGLTDILFATTSYAVNGRYLPIGFQNLPTLEAPAAERALCDLIMHD